MAQARDGGFWARCVGFSVAAIVAALFGASGVVHAACTNCTNVGTGSLASVTSASDDSAFGFDALNADTTGSSNTATGAFALDSNTLGSENTATGVSALSTNTAGGDNTATGLDALGSNTTGSDNTATGEGALLFNNGFGNTATGVEALESNTTGSNNIAVGTAAGLNLTTGNNNIDIGNTGVAAESNTIRIGVQGTQTATFIAGILNHTISSSFLHGEVCVNVNGRLGECPSTLPISFKRDIPDMGGASPGLMKLRPVSFRYKKDPAGTVQYGVIAEEVKNVYPELVTYGTDGKIMGVRYDLLPAMLLNDMQKQAKQIKALVAQQRQAIGALKKKDAQIDALVERINALEREARLARPQRLAAAAR